MSKRSRKRGWLPCSLGVLRETLRNLARQAGQVLRREPVPIEIVLVDRTRRRGIRRDVSATVRRLNRLLGDQAPAGVVIVVQQVIPPGKHLAGCCQVVRTAERGQLAVVRLALQVGGRRLSPDELLSTLVEQYLGLAFQQSGGASVLVPINLDPPEDGAAPTRSASLPPSPFGQPSAEGQTGNGS
jgi:hypothetical protein